MWRHRLAAKAAAVLTNSEEERRAAAHARVTKAPSAVVAAATGPACTTGRPDRQDARRPPAVVGSAAGGRRPRAARVVASARPRRGGRRHPAGPICAPVRWAAPPRVSARTWNARVDSPPSARNVVTIPSGAFRGGYRRRDARSPALARVQCQASDNVQPAATGSLAMVPAAAGEERDFPAPQDAPFRRAAAAGAPMAGPKGAARRRGQADRSRAAGGRWRRDAAERRHASHCAPERSRGDPDRLLVASGPIPRPAADPQRIRRIRSGLRTAGRNPAVGPSSRAAAAAVQPTAVLRTYRDRVSYRVRGGAGRRLLAPQFPRKPRC